MRLLKRVAKIMGLILILCALLMAGAGYFAYALVTDSDTAARLIKAQVARFLPRSLIDMGRVNIRLLAGEVTISHLHVRQRIDGQPFVIATIPWLSVRIDARQMIHGKYEAREVTVTHPTLRLCQRKDGTWNLQGLLSDPLPSIAIKNPPPIVIHNGTVELCGAGDPASGTSSAAVVDGSSADHGGAILRDVNLRVEPAQGGRYHFEGSARGDLFDRLTIDGSIDPYTGDVTLTGELAALTLSENLRRRLPTEVRAPFAALALNQGEIDMELHRLAFHPAAPPDKRFDYDIQARLHGGVWECPSLPFPVNDLSANLAIHDGLISIKHAEGHNGATTLRVEEGTLALGHSSSAPFDVRLDLLHLELDQQRLRKHTPAEFDELWDVFKPSGHIDAFLHLVRQRENGPVGVGATVLARDVAGMYRHFPYQLEHMSGELTLEKKRLLVDLKCLIGEKPARLAGMIDNPGPDAVVNLKIEAESVPIDAAFMDALQPEVRKVVDRFHPSGSVKAAVNVFREPLVGPKVKPEGRLIIDALLDLNPRCEITWVDLPYPIRNLTGQLELHPDLWIFKNMRGRNGQEIITGNGRVRKMDGPNLPSGEPPLKIDLRIQAENLPFNEVLRRSLQAAWRKTWTIINPTGASDVDATIHIEPGKPDINQIKIFPRPESTVRLVIPRIPATGNGADQGGTIELRMENVRGRFDFDNGKVSMHDVNFFFHGAPVQFAKGEVMVEDSGRFALSASDLWVKEIRLDSSLRNIMPPLMAQFALRLDDGRPFTARGDLQIGWSGTAGELAWCRFDKTRAVFIDNSLKAGIPLEHIQGQLEEVSGWSNGQVVEVQGIVRLGSVSFLGQQITQLESPFQVKNGVARLIDLRGKLLRGELQGNGAISLDATPKYSTSLRLLGAEIQEYAQTQPGRQTYRGTLNAAIDLSGLGTDIRGLQGKGDAHVTQGSLGEMPVVLRFAKLLNINLALLNSSRGTGKSMFDTADVEFRIVNGETLIDPIKFTGSAFSLQGRGKRDPMGNLDLRLHPLYGRDRFHLPILSDAIREVSGQFLIIRVVGNSSGIKSRLEPLPPVQKLGGLRGERN